MKTFAIIALLAILSMNASAQAPVQASAAQQKAMIEKIMNTETSIKSIQCSFVQTKNLTMLNDKMVSKGIMIYLKPNMLRWEYISPYKYLFIINGAKVLIKSGDKKSSIDVKSSKMFQEITRIMMNNVTGKNLLSSSDFNVRMFTQKNYWIADLTPKKKQMRSMFSSIKIYFDSSNSTVSQIDMFEKSGDKTEIRLKNPQINNSINEKLFDLD